MEQKIDKQDECYIIEYHLEILKIVIYSFIGIFVFFIPIKLNGEWLTLIYHIGYKLQQDITPFLKMITVLYVTLGCIKPIVKNKNVDMYFYINLFSILIILNIFYLKDSIIVLDNNALLVMEDLILNIITIFPISAIFMTFLLNYGLLDIVESYTQKIMKKTFNISGKSLVNILVYFFTDCFCGMFMTNKLYESGKLREKEACIIILSFSILSFNVIKYICEELNLNIFIIIIISLIILSMINIILYKTYPLNKKKKNYYIKTNYKETIYKKNKLKQAMNNHIENKTSNNIFKEVISNFGESIKILIDLIPRLVLVLYLGQIIINSELIVETFNLLLNPIIEIFKINNGRELGLFLITSFHSTVIGIDLLNKNIHISTKLLIGIISILSCISVSSMIYIKNTAINISKKEFLISYIKRIILIIFIYYIMYYLYIGYMA